VKQKLSEQQIQEGIKRYDHERGGAQMAIINPVTQGDSTMNLFDGPLPPDLQRYLDDGVLHEAAAVRIARRRQVEEVLWSLAERAGIAEELGRRLA